MKASGDQLPDLVPVRMVGEVSVAELQRSLSGFVSKKILDEASAAVEAAIRDPKVDPFRVSVRVGSGRRRQPSQSG